MAGTWRIAGLWVAGALACHAGPLSEVEITQDPVQNGSQITTVRMTPGETRLLDTLVFDCVYHQDFVSRTSDQSPSWVNHEPAVFTVRRKEVKLVEELDVNVSFRVPVAMERLVEMYGPTAFKAGTPVTVSRIRISALVKGVVLWRYEFDAKGLYRNPAQAGGDGAASGAGGGA